MKNICIAVLLTAMSLSSYGQTLHYDSTLGRTYVNIQPVTWVRNQAQVTRLYINTTFDDLTAQAQFKYELRASVVIDNVTTDHPLIIGGNDTITGDDYGNWDPASKYLFTYEAAKLNITIVD